ncbi:uncharacterized protein [Nicotiana tomentosiformis]|uniref:uncharacterized protein n=1 Tax=Nicotiana tomentosiformis TaxID=4098 RepID=UPI00388C656F
MESDSIPYVQKCHQCQIHGDFIHVPLNELNVMGSPWSFAAWGMDVIGHIESTKSNGHHFILVAIDYFTKWGEVSTHKAVTKKRSHEGNLGEVQNCPPQLHNLQTTNEWGSRGSQQEYQENSAKYKDNHRRWHEKISFTLLGYRTTMRTSTGEPPYMLVYGIEVVIPTDVDTPTLKVIQEVKLDDEEWIWARQEQLMLIEGKRMDAICHGQLYQNRTASEFNKRVKPRQFTLGKLVQKKILPPGRSQRNVCTKLARSLCGSPSAIGWCSNRGRNGWKNQHEAHEHRCNQEILCLEANRDRFCYNITTFNLTSHGGIRRKPT